MRLAPHMRLLGKEVRASLEPAGASSSCLIDIPRWDFHWQQDYSLMESTRVQAKKGDSLRLTCVYDDSAANQPVVNGSKKAPEEVTWGEGTLDEMCLLYIGAMVPFDAPDIRCGAFPGCVDGCAEGDGACFLDCMSSGGGQCGAGLGHARHVPRLLRRRRDRSTESEERRENEHRSLRRRRGRSGAAGEQSAVHSRHSPTRDGASSRHPGGSNLVAPASIGEPSAIRDRPGFRFRRGPAWRL